jgi:hypothetical protein
MFAEHDFSKPMFSINLENGERYWPIGPLKAAPRETIVSPETLNRLHMQLAGMMK